MTLVDNLEIIGRWGDWFLVIIVILTIILRVCKFIKIIFYCFPISINLSFEVLIINRAKLRIIWPNLRQMIMVVSKRVFLLMAPLPQAVMEWVASMLWNDFGLVDKLKERVNPALGRNLAMHIIHRIGASCVEIFSLDVENRLVWLNSKRIWIVVLFLVLLENDILGLEPESVLLLDLVLGAPLLSDHLLLLALAALINIVAILPVVFGGWLLVLDLLFLFLLGLLTLLLASLTDFLDGHCELEFGPLVLLRPDQVELAV